MPAAGKGRLTVVIAEEWHTVDTIIRLGAELQKYGLTEQAVLLWNANNTISFHRIDWQRLNEAAQITTVSRYMKHRMWSLGVNPMVIPNGIPARLLRPVDPEKVASLRSFLDPAGNTIVLFKAGRFDPVKRWLMAIDAAAQIKHTTGRVAFPLIGSIEPHGAEVLAHARSQGLSIVDVYGQPQSFAQLLHLLRAAGRHELYNLHFLVGQDLLRIFYAAADAVLANSGHEPFGLVGLEAMAAGAIVFTGSTGEEYTVGTTGAICLDTDQPEEITLHLLHLQKNPARQKRYAPKLKNMPPNIPGTG